MNYFELFDMPVQLQVDRPALSKKYFELSRLYHPDFHTQSRPEEQAQALERSALLNKAWRTFGDPDETIRYVLLLKGVMQEEEKYELPDEFLMEVMEINEALMDAEDPETSMVVAGKLENLELEIREPVNAILKGYRGDETTDSDLLAVKEYYYKKKYLDRLRRQLSGMA